MNVLDGPLSGINILDSNWIANPKEFIIVVSKQCEEFGVNKNSLLLQIMDIYEYFENRKLVPNGFTKKFGLTAQILD